MSMQEDSFKSAEKWLKLAEKYDVEEMEACDGGIISFKRNASIKYERKAAEEMQKAYASAVEKKSGTATDDEILMNPFAGLES